MLCFLVLEHCVCKADIRQQLQMLDRCHTAMTNNCCKVMHYLKCISSNSPADLQAALQAAQEETAAATADAAEARAQAEAFGSAMQVSQILLHWSAKTPRVQAHQRVVFLTPVVVQTVCRACSNLAVWKASTSSSQLCCGHPAGPGPT